MARRNAADTERTRTAILEGAAEVFTRHGYGAASLSLIAKEAGVTKSLLHHHFGSKAGLWSSVRDSAFEAFAREQAQMFSAADPNPQVITDGLRRYFRFLQENPVFLRLIRWTEAEHGQDSEEPDGAYKRGLRAVVGNGIEWVRRAQQAGAVRDDIEAAHIFIACIAMLRQWFVARDWIGTPSDEDYLESVLAITFNGVIARPTVT